MKIKSLRASYSAFILSVGTLFTFAFLGVAHAAGPYTCTWTGGGDGASFNDASNWSGCNSASPQAGDNDNLVFDSTSLGADTSLNNNVSGLALTSITFSGSNSNYYDFTLTGDAISLSGGIVVGSSDFPTIDTNLTLTTSQAITGGGVITFGDTNNSPTLNASTYTLTIGSGSDQTAFFNNDGAINGSGSLVAESGSDLGLSGASSSWTGSIIADGTANIFGQPGGFGSASSVTIANGASLCLGDYNGGDFAPNLTIGGTDALFASTSCEHGGGNLTYDASASVDLTGNLTLTANTTIQTQGTVTVSGALSGSYTLSLDSGEVGLLDINSSNNTSQSANGNQTSALLITTVAAGDNQPASDVFVGPNQEYIIDGVRGQTEVGSDGILKGTGTVGILLVDAASGSQSAGIVSPGDAPGCITVSGTLNEGGIYQEEIGGTTACSGYDQLNVTGTVTLNDGGTPPIAGTLQISLINGFKPSAGQTFEIINNESSTAVSGTFSGLPEGSEITISGYVFKISYVGGTGNDVVLSVVSVPKTPSTGLALVSNRTSLVTITATTIGAVVIILIARRYKSLTSKK